MTRFRSFYKIPRFGKNAAKIYIQIGFMKKPGKNCTWKLIQRIEKIKSHFRRWILLYFEMELADKLGTNAELDPFSKL